MTTIAQPPVFAEMGGIDDAKLKSSGYTTKNRLLTLWTTLESERSSWDTHWRDLADFILPRRVRFNTTDRNKGDKRNQKIINNAATLASRTLRSGMMAGLTSPARPWFKLTLFDQTLLQHDAVKYWLDDVTRLMNGVMHRSNLYNSLGLSYGDLGVFGTTALGVFEDDEKVVRTNVPPLGSYVLSVNDRGVVDCFAREIEMTVRQVVMKFGTKREKSGSIDMSNMSAHVRNAWLRDNFEAPVNVLHFILPNEAYDPMGLYGNTKRFKSCYFEEAQDPNKFLSESGFDEFPMLCPRWDLLDNDTYGTSPGMDALGDTKSLQILERRKAQAIEKIVNPPMTGPSSLRNQKASLLAGDVTFVDVREGQQGFRPAHEVNFPVKDVMLDIQEHRQRISRAFYEDLFLMLTLSDRREITAREVEERHQEKLIALGPVLERLNDEMLDPLIDRVFAVMARRGLLPPAPQVMEGMPLKVEYSSILAQAQRMVNAAGVERFAGFVRQMGELDPTVFDKANVDYMVEEYGDMMSVAPRSIRSDEEVEAIRNDRRERAMAQERAENIEKMAKAGKAMSTSPMGQNTLLDAAAEAVGEVED